MEPLSVQEAIELVKEYKYEREPKSELYKEWEGYFGEYNKDVRPRLSMGCMICYQKVYLYLKNKNAS